jgi:hypothetical protein
MAEGWTEFTVAVVENAFPTDLGTLYATWIDANPGKASRLSEVVAEVRTTFRQAVATNPANEVDEDADKIPSTGFRHALNSVLFSISMEMGVELSPLVFGLITRADVWLRMVQNGMIPIRSGDTGTASYERPGGERWLLL